jgi:NAD(P)-dependent dehydrogenase (short-subunit alcohol dehydrogenase family)
LIRYLSPHAPAIEFELFQGSSMSKNGKPEVVVITGASAGVGRATAQAYARRGAHIGLLARGRAGLEAAKRDVESLGGRAIILQADVADAEAVELAAAMTEEAFGPIDIWVNNAMNSVFSPVKEMKPEEYVRVTEVTYLGYVYGVLSALKRMLPRDHGTIVNVGSALAYRGIPLQSAYCGAKHAIQGFTESLRTELIHDGSNVHVTEVHLPAINTPQFRWVKSRLPKKSQPVPPIFQPELAADAVLMAVDERRREVWLAWPVYKTILGNKVAPWYVDRKLAAEGVEGQQLDEPYEERPHNLWEPVDENEDYGAHGEFDDRASDWSAIHWANRRRGLVTAVGAGLLAGVAGMLIRNGQREEEPQLADRARDLGRRVLRART